MRLIHKSHWPFWINLTFALLKLIEVVFSLLLCPWKYNIDLLFPFCVYVTKRKINAKKNQDYYDNL